MTINLTFLGEFEQRGSDKEKESVAKCGLPDETERVLEKRKMGAMKGEGERDFI